MGIKGTVKNSKEKHPEVGTPFASGRKLDNCRALIKKYSDDRPKSRV